MDNIMDCIMREGDIPFPQHKVPWPYPRQKWKL